MLNVRQGDNKVTIITKIIEFGILRRIDGSIQELVFLVILSPARINVLRIHIVEINFKAHLNTAVYHRPLPRLFRILAPVPFSVRITLINKKPVTFTPKRGCTYDLGTCILTICVDLDGMDGRFFYRVLNRILFRGLNYRNHLLGARDKGCRCKKGQTYGLKCISHFAAPP